MCGQLASELASYSCGFGGVFGGVFVSVFGGVFEDASANVLADSDLTFVGFSGTADLGNVLVAGLDQAALEALLTNAVYTGQLGSGQQVLDLVVVPEPSSLALLGLGGLMALRRRRSA